ncbi:hypothetical protein CAEBREN_21922 [Caenorhabditis brenneri]|uniref:Serpentine receptor class gamma n=1 Tax=Caenorhabditis brenneri TaxID=135651 RepID=G0NQA2_CAEBE|nr:hypothetical protein CAEBREN_21922 [Caenorhabditis brenneri]
MPGSPPESMSFWGFLTEGSGNFYEIYYIVMSFLCGTLFILFFPLYAYMIKKNREKDKDALIYPIIESFYRIMVLSFAILIVEQLIGWAWLYFGYKEQFLIMRITGIVFDGVTIILNYFFQFMLSILAIQKFFLYFFEPIRRFVELSPTKMRIGIYFLYFVFLLKLAGKLSYQVSCHSRMPICLTIKKKRYIYEDTLISFKSINIFFITTSLLYIPIMISIMKLTNLRSVKETQPQKYILWQTLAVLIAKLVTFSSFSSLFLKRFSQVHLPMYFYLYYNGYDPFADLYYFARLDWYTAPLTMQVSYSGSNKKNLEILFGFLKKKFKLGSASVEPTLFENTSTAERRGRGSTS